MTIDAIRAREQRAGETARQARQRREQNRLHRNRWQREQSELCAQCGFTRGNVRHEQDPASAPEGHDYYADMLDELHEFVPDGWRASEELF